MIRWTVALGLSSVATYVLTEGGRRRAFKAGWFERSSQTRRSRRQRRPTHGGLVLGLTIGLCSLLAGPSQPVVQASALGCLIAVLGCARSERGRERPWEVWAVRVAAAGVLPAFGIRAEITGGDVSDAVATVLLTVALMLGFRSIERTDATSPFVAAVSSLGFLVLALRFDDPTAAVAAALAGATGAMTASTWPPALARLGSTGPVVLGVSLAAVGIHLDPPGTGIDAPVMTALVLATPLLASLIPQWDRRLGARGITPRWALPVASACAVAAADRVAADALEPAIAVLGLLPVCGLALIGFATPLPRVAHRRGVVVAGWVAGAALVAIALIGGLQLITARSDMEEGREYATRGLDAARDGDLEEAEELFRTADAAFAEAASALDNPAVLLGQALPLAGPNLRSARTLASVGGDLSSTAVAIAERAGADDLEVVDGRFPIEGAQAVSADLAVTLDTLERSAERLDDSSSELLVGEVRRGSDTVADHIDEAIDSLEVAAESTRLVPDLLGASGDRRWMVAVLTPSEQRGAGGLAGDYAELSAIDGDVELVRTIPASDLNDATDPAEQIEALPAIYRDRYQGFQPGVFWQNLSATPDVPTMAQGIASAFPLTDGGGPVDGVVVIDPHGMEALLSITGPVRVPGWPEPINQRNATDVLLFEQYDQLSEEEIDEFQGDVVEAVVDALTTGTLPPPSELAAKLAPAVEGGHLRLWSPEAEPQALFERIGADGTLEGPGSADYLQLVTQNASESKIDWYLRREMVYEPFVDPETGLLRAIVTVTLTNTAPVSGVSSYVIGEDPGPTAVGENELQLTLLTPHRATQVTDTAGQVIGTNIGTEKGLNAVTVLVDLDAGQSKTYVFTLEGRLEPTEGTYDLRIGRQPAVVPDRIEVRPGGLRTWRPAGAGARPIVLEDDHGGAVRIELQQG